jgi:myo-inositol-1(or 4)-monophosphatase
MKPSKIEKALASAIDAAERAGKLLRKNLHAPKKANMTTQHDIKLELDVRCQELIEKKLLKAFPKTAVLGEEGIHGSESAEYRWVVDPIDGTVNYAYGIPHACVSIALQKAPLSGAVTTENIVLGVIYDPFLDELWTAIEGEPARLNGRKIHVSNRSELNESIVITGFAKEGKNTANNLALFSAIVPQVRKVRIMGSAALALAYVASGRLDVYAESGLHLWDIAAGKRIVESAGGRYWDQPFGAETDPGFHTLATNQKIWKKAETVLRAAWKM